MLTPAAALSPAQSPPSRASDTGRLAAINIFRGLAILEVVLHHVSGLALERAAAGSNLHLLLAALNRTLHFAVPAFLFMTAAVLTRSALRSFAPGRYYWNRVKKSLLPYVLWTAIYAVFKVLTGQNEPEVLLSGERWLFWLQYGKAYYHLYFLLIALQFYLVLPLLLPLWRRRWPLWLVIVAAFGAQLLVYWLNRDGRLLHFRFPGTMALWYLPTITLGMAFGANYDRFESLWRRQRLLIIAAAAVGLGWYVPLAVNALLGNAVSGFQYSLSSWMYTTAIALLLFGVAHSLARAPAWIARPLGLLGGVSLQIYLLHPAILFGLGRLGFPGDERLFALTAALTAALYAALALLPPFWLARRLEGRPLSQWLFGR